MEGKYPENLLERLTGETHKESWKYTKFEKVKTRQDVLPKHVPRADLDKMRVLEWWFSRFATNSAESVVGMWYRDGTTERA